MVNTTGSVSLGSAWSFQRKRQIQNPEKTVQGGKYQTEQSMGIQGRITFGVPPGNASVDPFDQWWYDQAKAQAPTLISQVKNQFVQNLNNGISIQYWQMNYDITFVQNFIPTSGVRDFNITGQTIIQFTDLTHPFGIDDLVLALIIIAIVAIVATAVILYELISVAGPVGATVGIGILALAIGVGIILLVGGNIGVSKKGVQIQKTRPVAGSSLIRRRR